MLTKRTNILFDEQTFKYLVTLANKGKTSVGELVRNAVIKVYFKPQTNQKRMKAFQNILRLKKGLGHTTAKEIKESINYGRKL
ncbi:hypothetical protein HY357_03005 [Candidatus Roizmanbacteria bacterium]|nr:hypothetical protein [Candidatus Roizmanbacteria bacterium]